MEKCGQFWKNSCFSGRIWPYWENTAWADMDGVGSKGKLGEDVGQPGIRAGDTRVSHTSPKGECGTPWYHQ